MVPAASTAVVHAALDAGMDVASGLHTRLSDVPAIAAKARERGRTLHDVRHSEMRFSTGKGVKRPGRRLLTVGTDCSVGKKYTALVLEREMRARGLDADFRATGQTGVFISGRGVAIDAVVADFISGAVEWIAPAALVIPYGTMSAVELSLTSIMDKVFVDDWGQCRRGRFGALRAHVDQGLVTEDTIAGELADVVAGTRPGRERDDERILFWHRGLATTDVALGQALLERAVEQGVGTLLPYR